MQVSPKDILSQSAMPYNVHKEDYLRVLVDKTEVKEVLDELEKLAKEEKQVVIAATYAGVRDGGLFYVHTSPQ